MKADREICASATDGPWEIDGSYIICGEYDVVKDPCMFSVDLKYIAHFNPQKVTQMLDRQERLESKLKEASEFIQKLGPTIDYDIVSEIEEMLK